MSIKIPFTRNTIFEVILLSDNNTNALSGSMNDQAAPSEADMAQRLQSSAQTKTSGLNTAAGQKQGQSKTELTQVLKDRAAE